MASRRDFVQKTIDTDGEPQAFGFKDVGVSENGLWARIVFVDRDQKEYPIQLAASLLATMLPSLINIDAESERRREGKNVRTAYKIEEGAISASQIGDNFVFDFTIPTGQHYAFELNAGSAKAMHSALSEALRLVEDRSGNFPPRQ